MKDTRAERKYRYPEQCCVNVWRQNKWCQNTRPNYYSNSTLWQGCCCWRCLSLVRVCPFLQSESLFLGRDSCVVANMSGSRCCLTVDELESTSQSWWGRPCCELALTTSCQNTCRRVCHKHMHYAGADVDSEGYLISISISDFLKCKSIFST